MNNPFHKESWLHISCSSKHVVANCTTSGAGKNEMIAQMISYERFKKQQPSHCCSYFSPTTSSMLAAVVSRHCARTKISPVHHASKKNYFFSVRWLVVRVSPSATNNMLSLFATLVIKILSEILALEWQLLVPNALRIVHFTNFAWIFCGHTQKIPGDTAEIHNKVNKYECYSACWLDLPALRWWWTAGILGIFNGKAQNRIPGGLDIYKWTSTHKHNHNFLAPPIALLIINNNVIGSFHLPSLLAPVDHCCYFRFKCSN